MIIVKNPFGEDPLDFYNESASRRVGSRIRRIREERGLTQAELGEIVGLSADRIQKYENGYRKPREDMLKKIATALKVSTLALVDPNTTSYTGAMFALFEMETIFNMYVEEGPENKTPSICFTVDVNEYMYAHMKEWLDVYKRVKAKLEIAASDAEKTEILKAYHNWKWNYPQSVADEQEAALAKARLKRRIEELQEVYDNLP